MRVLFALWALLAAPLAFGQSWGQQPPDGGVSPGSAGSVSRLTGCVYNSAAQTLTNGQQVATQCDSAGSERYVLPPSIVSTYTASIGSLVPGTGATDVLTITGSSSKKIIVQSVNVSGIQTTAGAVPISLVKRSALNTGGGVGTVIQSQKSLTTASSTTGTVTVTATGSGNLLVVQAMDADNRTISSVSDGTNAFTQATGAAGNTAGGGGIDVDTWYLLSSTAGKTTITVTYSGTSTTKSIFFWEVSSGGAAFQIAGRTNSGTIAATDTGASITPTATAFIVSTIGTAGTITAAPAAGNTAFTNGSIQSNSTSAAVWNFQPIGTYTPTWSDSGAGTFATTVAAFTATGNVLPTVTAVPHDSGQSAATAAVDYYYTNPTLGTAVGPVRSAKFFVPTTSSTPEYLGWSFPTAFAKGIVLNNANESLNVNLGGTTIAGGLLSIDVEWTEQ